MARKRPITTAEEDSRRFAEELVATGLFDIDEAVVTEETKPVTEETKPVTEEVKPVTEETKPVDGKPEDVKPDEVVDVKPEEETTKKKVKKIKAPKASKKKTMGILKKVLILTVVTASVVTAAFSAMNFFKISDINKKIDEGIEIENPSGELPGSDIEIPPIVNPDPIVETTKIEDDARVDVLKNLGICKSTKMAEKYSNVEILNYEGQGTETGTKVAYVKMDNEKGETVICPIAINCEESTTTANAIKNGAQIVSGTQFDTFYAVDSLFNEEEKATAVSDYVKAECGNNEAKAYVTKVLKNEKTGEVEYSFMTVSNDGNEIKTIDKTKSLSEYNDNIGDFYSALAGVAKTQESERTR